MWSARSQMPTLFFTRRAGARHRDRRRPSASDVSGRRHSCRTRAPGDRPGDGDPRRLSSWSRSTPPSCLPRAAAASDTCSRSGIMHVDDFVDAVRRVAEGGTTLDPEVVAQLFSRRGPPRRAHAAGAGSARADGGRPLERGHRIDALPQLGSVEKHIGTFFSKPGLRQTGRMTGASRGPCVAAVGARRTGFVREVGVLTSSRCFPRACTTGPRHVRDREGPCRRTRSTTARG